jgi:hypothetical protein
MFSIFKFCYVTLHVALKRLRPEEEEEIFEWISIFDGKITLKKKVFFISFKLFVHFCLLYLNCNAMLIFSMIDKLCFPNR